MSIDKNIKKRLLKSFTKSNHDLKQFIIDIINRDDLLMALLRGEDVNKYLENVHFINVMSAAGDNSRNTEYEVDNFPKWFTDCLKTESNFKFNPEDNIVEE
mmetsp:Transcript_33388/g.28217  ORF Transcript_33388/g.28217 Transcript_33388/m.28217 type:complete len:101 (-) Transcript_33388:2436-2738(-)